MLDLLKPLPEQFQENPLGIIINNKKKENINQILNFKINKQFNNSVTKKKLISISRCL